ncbi:hypothetical protein EVAR_34703_1 [Eumeta japonica]|uniref:RNA-directed DNA polymerase from transposon BS n=1 Tax=Eumeta variegata TaxID=151549 RepID=A0A4C1XGY9_EUMVA|nr:hypothetical protein EVAR_34703_1 [Eumeta japonica]
MEGAVLTPALKRPYNCIAFDDREKADCLADSIEHQCSDNLPYDLEHVRRVEEEVRHRVSPQPKDDLDPFTHDEVSKHIKGLKIRKASVRPIRAGVPQSSTLSRLLYSAFVNDILRPSTGVQLALFSDDTALYLRSNRIGNILASAFFDVASSHPHLLLVSAVSYEPTPPHHFCRRPRNVLIDPPDDLTVELEKLIELNEMAINKE